RTRGRRGAVRRGEEGGARRASGDRSEDPVAPVGGRAGNRRGAGARRAEPRLRGEVRLPLRRLRRSPAEGGDRAGAARTVAADARARARDRARRARLDRGGQMATVLAISDYWWGWGNLLFRWLHVIAAIAWIGSSFYFIALDHHLAPPAEERDAARGVSGEAWEIHGRRV